MIDGALWLLIDGPFVITDLYLTVPEHHDSTSDRHLSV